MMTRYEEVKARIEHIDKLLETLEISKAELLKQRDVLALEEQAIYEEENAQADYDEQERLRQENGE